MRIAVVGAHGLTGGATVRALAERGHEVVAVVRRDAPVPFASETVVGPGAPLGSVDAIVHVAGIQLAEGLRALPAFSVARRVVVVSTASVYSAHRPHAAIYRRNEDLLLADRPDVTLVRPTMIYGSQRDRNVHRVVAFARRAHFLPVPGAGTALVQPIHYLDLASSLARLVEVDAPGVVDAAGAASLSVADAARVVLRAIGYPEVVIRVPLEPARRVSGLIDRLWSTRWRERIERALEDRSVDGGRLASLTGVSPRPFDKGVGDMLRAEHG